MTDRYGPVVRAAAVALLDGWGNPLTYLEAEDGVERMFADAVVEEAELLRTERERRFWEQMSAAVQNGVARAFKS